MCRNVFSRVINCNSPTSSVLNVSFPLHFVSHFLFYPRRIDVDVQAQFTADFITSPKDKEAFVGDSVQLDWDYKDDADQVGSIKFGRTTTDGQGNRINRAILVKSPDGTVYYRQVDSPLRKRISAPTDRRASFKFTDVTMNDTGKYFCSLTPKDIVQTGLTDYVRLKVVGK